ncbi:hypothetical protein EA797_15620 [Stutzerimonas zhaodongensis]|uniref:SGNH/GDSL hydrolase family protein n=1 Tax=Stutzerimonas zhaodongensis TaxID=1176257 RepID=A0A3M2HN72_9GAMM|nr:hypothetical protein [Stutzerimonas zhaodongensis]MCQ4315821.1 hypothetical protein [Stutzerimonas zhaodongensis]RMH89353.1 hypothetical protein EA797_15620 [Stutzerimonas zhaodongensis]
MVHAADFPKDGSATDNRKDTTASAPGKVRSRYLISFFAGLTGALMLFCATLFGLDRTGNLPPPAFSNNLCVDEKLNFLRDNPIQSPNLLVIGSSVAWRHVDSQILASALPEIRPMNGAFCGLFANQSTYVGHWLLDRAPSIRSVVMIADPQDFAGCWRVPAAVFNREHVDPYVYEGDARWGYYMRYFSPKSLARNALTVKAQRAGQIEWDPLVFNRYGDGPLITNNTRKLLYGRPDPLDRSCFAALRDMGARLAQEGRQLMVVSTPLHPDWKEKYDPDGTFMADFDKRIADALNVHGGTYWNADKDWHTPTHSFVDAVHMRWSAVQDFTVALAEQISNAATGPTKPPGLETAALR